MTEATPSPLYSPEQLRTLAAAHRIATGEQLSAVAQWLERAGAHYLDMAAWESTAERRAALAAEMEAVTGAAEALRAVLAGLSEDGRAQLRRAADTAGWRALIRPASREGHTAGAVVAAGGAALLLGAVPDSTHTLPWNAEWVDLAAAGLAANARQIAEAQAGPGGRPFGSHALRVWVENMRTLWTEVLGRRFTYDAHRGEGVTRAYAFCRDALLMLDPAAPLAELDGAMRKTRTAARIRASEKTDNNPPLRLRGVIVGTSC